ncbi:DUF2187 family protein [Alkalihalobacterium elongatum]|uniref:DUF2187 family protein n=1 Tax=Alkalihalobacterium elongatum TaxID=2675466 RepID=UPI001C200AB1|nr:DUF2187 family protein [Alkalihalobacterium elongatum]
MSEEQESHVNVGDIIQINKGVEKGENAKVIAVYTNSVAVELNRKEKNGNLARTVVNHSKYVVKS